MGFFSQQCLGCHQSVVAPYDLSPEMEWLNYVVAIQPDGALVSGVYDGYGRVEPDEDDERDETVNPCDDAVVGTAFTNAGGEDLANSPAVWHAVCWGIAGQPREYPGQGSPGAADQGYFFDAEDYIVSEPETVEDVQRIRKYADAVAARNRRELQEAMAEFHKAQK